MRELCELCRRETLEHVYKPESSTRGLTVHLCRYCGLVQSLPRADRATRAPAAVSSGADWGNVRYGKSFRTDACLNALAQHFDLDRAFSMLDVGSNRGSFARALLTRASGAHLVAVEPDERFADSCADLPRTSLVNARIEQTALETERFDVVHSCHTIEHLAHPAWSLLDHWRVLKPGGLLVLDAPNIAILGADDIVEEWFIDKHLYHFSKITLERMLKATGFSIVEHVAPGDQANLLFVARKDHAAGYVGMDGDEVERAEQLVTGYIAARARNLMALTAVAAELVTLAPKGVAIWGAGRLFDSLVVHGRFDASTLSLLIDKHLKPLVGTLHGQALAAPEALVDAKPEIVVIMSRGFAGEIEAEARKLAPLAEIVTYSDLLSRARTRLAA
jgi:SAM-dependent methyltransferase